MLDVCPASCFEQLVSAFNTMGVDMINYVFLTYIYIDHAGGYQDYFRHIWRSNYGSTNIRDYQEHYLYLRRIKRFSRWRYDRSRINRKPSDRAKEDGRLEEIQAVHKRTRQTCGPDRLQKDLADHGVQVGVYRIRKIRKELGIKVQADWWLLLAAGVNWQ